MEKVKVFLGGTCGTSTWRKELIPMLDPERVEYFDPQLPPGAWNLEAQKIEDFHRDTDDIRVYVLTPEGEGDVTYSHVEVTDDSNKRPERTVLLVLLSANGKEFTKHGLKVTKKTAQLVADNGVHICETLEELAAYLNSLQVQIEDENRTVKTIK